MSNLQLNNPNNLPSKNEELKNALTATKIKNSLPHEIGGVVSIAIEKAIFYLGLKTEQSDRDLIKITVIEDVKKHFPSLTLSEIGLAIENGSKGVYGKVMGLAPKDAYLWLYEFSQSTERKQVLAIVSKENDIPLKPTDEELKSLAWDNTVRAWETYKENNYFNDYGNIVYKYLAKNGKINYSEDQRNDFKRMAKAALNSQYNPSNSVGNAIKMNEHRHILKEVNSSDDNARLISEAKKLALNHFFKELKEIGSEIQDLFIEE